MHDSAPRHPESRANQDSTQSLSSGLGLGPCLVLADTSVWSQLDQLLAQLPAPTTTAARLTDPYAALLELLRRPMAFRAVVISLQKIFPTEIALIKTLRERLGHIDVVLTHTDGRAAALAEALRLGATALLDADGLHRLAHPQHQPIAHSHPSHNDPTVASITALTASGPSDAPPSLADVFASIHAPANNLRAGDSTTPIKTPDPQHISVQPSHTDSTGERPNLPTSPQHLEHLQDHSNDPIDETHDGEPILTADELRALLQDSESR